MFKLGVPVAPKTVTRGLPAPTSLARSPSFFNEDVTWLNMASLPSKSFFLLAKCPSYL